MNNKIKKKSGRSEGFRKEQNKLVKEIVKGYHHSEFVESLNIPFQIEPAQRDSVFDQSAIESEYDEPMQCSNENDIDRNISDEESVIEINISNDENTLVNKKKSRDFPFNKIEFQSALATWSASNEIKHEQLRGLLKIWNEYVLFQNYQSIHVQFYRLQQVLRLKTIIDTVV